MSDTPEVPKSCQEIDNAIGVLRWTRSALKELPNLPKGKLQELLEIRVRSVIAGGEDPYGQLLDLLHNSRSVLSLLNNLMIERLTKKGRPPLTDFEQDSVNQALDCLGKVISLLNRIRP